jgi:hypothetical protein
MPNPTIDAALAGARHPYSFHKVTGTMEAAGVRHSLWMAAGMPGPAATPAAGLAGEALTAVVTGQLPWANPASGETRLFRCGAGASSAGRLLLCDRLWQNSGLVVTTTTAQTINSVTLPSRCPGAPGTSNTNGNFIQAALEVSTATTNGSPITNTTISYTNQAGVAGRTGTISSFPATAVAGTFVEFSLQSGDTGVRSIQTCTLGTSYGGGAIHLVLFRRIFALELPDLSGRSEDMLTSGYPQFFDDSVPWWLWHPTGTATTTITGEIQVTQPG